MSKFFAVLSPCGSEDHSVLSSVRGFHQRPLSETAVQYVLFLVKAFRGVCSFVDKFILGSSGDVKGAKERLLAVSSE